MEHTEIIAYMREDIRRTLESEGVPQHAQTQEAIDAHLIVWLSTAMASMIVSMRLADCHCESDYARRQLWNW